MIRRLILATIMTLNAVSSGCKFNNSKSSTKEFEFSSDICRDLQQAVDRRWTSSLGMSKAAYHATLIDREAAIINYELPRYRKRMEEVKNGTGPANGPNGKTGTLPPKPSSTPDITINTVPSNKYPSSNDFDSYSNDPYGGLALTETSFYQSETSASGVCPGCDQRMIENKLASLERNRLSVRSCVYRDTATPSNSSSANDPNQGLSPAEQTRREETVDKLKDLIYASNAPKQVCSWFSTWATGISSSQTGSRCRRDVVQGFCRTVFDAGGDIAVDGINGNTSYGGIGSDIAKPIPSAVKDAIFGCARQLAFNQAEEALRTGTFGGLTKSIADLGARLERERNLKRDIALEICKAGAGLLAAQIDAAPQIDYNHPCQAIFKGSKSRAKACLNSTASGCRIAAGDVDLKNFFPQGIPDDKPLVNLTAEAANTITKLGCLSAGSVSKVACGTISEAASQIRSAITTGNNDWAHCVGTDQAGACAGTKMAELWLGINVADLSKPNRLPYDIDIPGSGQIQLRDACVCDHACYEDDWGTDSLLQSGTYAGIAIKTGDAGIRDCQNQEGAWNWISPNTGYKKSQNGYYMYWKTSNCRIRQLKGMTSVGNHQVRASVLTGSSFSAPKTLNLIADVVCP